MPTLLNVYDPGDKVGGSNSFLATTRVLDCVASLLAMEIESARLHKTLVSLASLSALPVNVA